MAFQPEVGEALVIGETTYRVAEHPAAPGIPYGQEGRQAIVYQVVPERGEAQALKVFKPRYRSPALVIQAERIAPYAALPGLQVCRRTVLTPQEHQALLRAYPDLTYAVLMPWVEGPTWLEVMVTKRALEPGESLTLARGLAEVLATLEQRRLAHCDLSGSNVMLPGLVADGGGDREAVVLVDVEQMYGPNVERPELLPGGSSGYVHRRAPEGVWGAQADRFAGAVLLGEMLGWCDERVRKAGWEETFFAPEEMQRETRRYQLLVEVLEERWGGGVRQLFERAWQSEGLAECPTFGEWLVVLPEEVPRPVGEVEAEERPAAVEGREEEEVEAGGLEAVRALMALARRFEAQEAWKSALEAYRQAQTMVPAGSGLAEELAATVQDLEGRIEEPKPPADVGQRERDETVVWEETEGVRSAAPSPGEALQAPASLETTMEGDVAFSPEGEPPASASSDGTIRLWQVPEAALEEAEPAGLFDERRLEERAEEAEALEQAGQWEEAAALYRQLVEEAEDLVRRTHWENARRRCEEEAALAARFDEGVAAYRAGKWQEAERALQEVVRARPGYVRQGRWAAELLAEVREKVPRTPASVPSRQEAAKGRPKRWRWIWGLLTLVMSIGIGVATRRLLAHPVPQVIVEPPVVVQVGTVKDTPVPAPTAEEAPTPMSAVAVAPTATEAPTPTPTPPSRPEGGRGGQTTPTLPTVPISADNAGGVGPVGRLGYGMAYWIAYSPDGRLVAVATGMGFSLYDGETLTPIWSAKMEVGTWGIAFSPDGDLLALASADGTVRLWRVADGEPLRTLEGHTGVVWSVAFSPDGDLLASASDDGTVRLWRVADGKLLRTLDGHTDVVWSVAFSPDGDLLASASADGTVRLWRVADGEPLRTLEGQTDVVWSVAFSPDGALLASASDDGTVRLWRMDDGKPLRTLEGHTDKVWGVAFSPDGDLLASASVDGTVRLWRVDDGAPLRTLEGHLGLVWSVAFSPGGATLASSGLDGIRLWRVSDGSLRRTLRRHGALVGVAFSPDGALLASASLDGTVGLWRVADGEPLRTLEGHTGSVRSVAFSPDGALLASASGDSTVRLWRVADGEPLRALEGHTGPVLSVAFSPDGELLASASWDGTVRLWRVADGEPLRTLEGHTDWVRSVAFSPNGALLASASDDGTVRLWRVADGELLRTLEGHTDKVWGVAFSPDGALLASASTDTTVRLWRVADGEPLRTLEGQTDVVWSVAFSPDGALLASASTDGTVQLWGVGE